MDKHTLLRTGIAGAVAAAGLTVGGIALATAQDAPGQAGTGTVAFSHDRGPDGPGRHAVFFGDEDLAKALGVSQSKLRAAMQKIGDQIRPSQRPASPPTEADRTAMRSKLAAALAKELGLSTTKVTAALVKVEAAHQTERRGELSDRLDAAVKAGKLDAGDKASVLKAFDAGVLGGPMGGPHP